MNRMALYFNINFYYLKFDIIQDIKKIRQIFDVNFFYLSN